MGLGDIFKIKQFKTQIAELEQKNQILARNNQDLQHATTALREKLSEIGGFDYYKVKSMTAQLEKECADTVAKNQDLQNAISEKILQSNRIEKQIKTQTNKLGRSKELVKAISYCIDNFFNYDPAINSLKLGEKDLNDLEELSPSVILKLHCMDVKDLRKAYRQNDKQITELLDKYSSRYTTKANQAIYKLMVIALRAELQRCTKGT